MIIDFHVHTFPKAVAEAAINNIGLNLASIRPFSDGTPEGILESMARTGISYSVNLPVPTNNKQVVKLNRLAVETKEERFSRGIINFGGMHPAYDEYKFILRDLASHGIRGIKIHPAFAKTDIDDIRCLRIMDYASELGLAIILHAGIELTSYRHNHCSVKALLRVIDEVRPETLILAHMGNLGCWKEAEEYLCGAPVWLDTSFSVGKIYEHPQAKGKPIMSYKMHRKDFTRMCRKHGIDRIIFGSDSPWGDQGMEINMIRSLDFTEEEKEMIFSGNARKILKI